MYVGNGATSEICSTLIISSFFTLLKMHSQGATSVAEMIGVSILFSQLTGKKMQILSLCLVNPGLIFKYIHCAIRKSPTLTHSHQTHSDFGISECKAAWKDLKTT